MRAHDGDMFDDEDYGYDIRDYYKACDRCDRNSTFATQPLCEDCEEAVKQEKLEEEYDEYETKAERREAEREKARYGPIRHLPGDFRPPKLRVRIRP